MKSQPKIARPRRGDPIFGRLRRCFSLTMHSGIARSARLAAASNLGSPDVHIILRRPLSPLRKDFEAGQHFVKERRKAFPAPARSGALNEVEGFGDFYVVLDRFLLTGGVCTHDDF
jgi:hypothetical protein